MDKVVSVKVLLLDGHYSHTLSVASELKRDLGATLICVGTNASDPLLRSRHSDISLVGPPPDSPAFRKWLVEQVAIHVPDAIVPIGYHSFAAMISLKGELSRHARFMVPPEESFNTAVDKARTYELAASLGIRVPQDLTASVSRALEDGSLSQLGFPLILKARLEGGGASTALVRSPEEMVKAHAKLTRWRGDILVQEYVDGDVGTFAHCGLYDKGNCVLEFMHHETRSVPRHGGSGTRVSTFSDPKLAESARALMAQLEWHGIAQVEFKRTAGSGYTLMEINPKLWASYSLASRSGHRFVSLATLMALELDGSHVLDTPKSELVMVFPIRELKFLVQHRDWRSLPSAALAMLWPPAVSDYELRDLPAYLPRPWARRTTQAN